MSYQPASTPQTKAAPLGPAVLLLDESGRVKSASPGACALWQAGIRELIGDSLPNLFAFEITSRDSDWQQAQWEVLVAATRDRAIALKLQPKEAAAFDAEVRIEGAGDEPALYFAHISRLPPSPAPASPQAAFQILQDRSPIGFFDLDFVANEARYSPGWKALLGYPESELANTHASWKSLIHPDDSDAAPDRVGRSPAIGSRPFSVEIRMRHASGSYVWMHCAGVQLHGPNGALQRVTGIMIDIQERKEAEEAGMRSEERLQALASPDGLWLVDLDFARKEAWCSDGLRAMLKVNERNSPASLDDLARALGFAGESDLASWFTSVEPAGANAEAGRLLQKPDGEIIPVRLRFRRHLSRRGELTRVIGWLSPESNAQAPGEPSGVDPMGVILGELREAVVAVDADGCVMLLNAKAEQLLGVPSQAALRNPVADLFRLVHRESGKPGPDPVAAALTTGEPAGLNEEFALADQGGVARRPIVWSCRPLVGPDGMPRGAVIVFRDPAELALTPEEIIRANRFDALGQLAGGIAHDFNNLLTTILGGVSLAKDGRDSSGLENSERACLAAKALSKQLLTFSKGGSSARQNVAPAEIIADAVRVAAAGSVVRVDVNVAPDLKPVSVDRGQILQVFQNLVINATQAMPAGEGNIWITAATVRLAEGEVPPLPAGEYVSVEVKDNGAGIPPENIEKIFSPFFTTKKTGTGLGLSTVASIVKRHGGQIGVQSEVGVGTTFTVFLPPASEEIKVEARRAPTLRYGTGRVLFMDDDPEISSLTAAMLDSLGYKYDLARNGDEAIQLYKRYLNIGRPYDTVIMDLTIIGGMGGEQCFRCLRELDPDVRAIIASGYDNDDMARQYLDMGFCGYLTKPYRVADLGRMIKTVVGQ